MKDGSSDNRAKYVKFRARPGRSKVIPSMGQSVGADHCPSCVRLWIDQASTATGLSLTQTERARLSTTLLSRQHLILAGPAGTGKRVLARELALSLVQGQSNHFRLIQGHPWWATQTGDLARFVSLQMEFSILRLLDFVEAAYDAPELSFPRQSLQGPVHVACIEGMSPVELDFYFGVFVRWLSKRLQKKAEITPLRLIGTYDSQQPPVLDQRILAQAAVVHLGCSMAD